MDDTSKGPRHWSPEHYADVQLCAEIGDTIETAAEFLGCSPDEVRQIARECGVKLAEGPPSSKTAKNGQSHD